jgi:hypothetical protein
MGNCLRKGARQRQPFLSLTLFPNIANRDQFLQKEGTGYTLCPRHCYDLSRYPLLWSNTD